MKPVSLLNMRCLTGFSIVLLGAWSLSASAYEVNELPDLWLVDIDVDAPAVLSARPDRHRRDDAPFEALVVFPAQTQAGLLATAAGAKDLPRERGCSKRTLRAAVDLDADGKADVTMFEFCCQKPTSPRTTSPCENTCQATYLRRSGQPWRLVAEGYDD